MVPTHSVSGLCWLQHGSSNLYQQVPLQNVRVDATLYDLCAEVKVHQTYVNNLSADRHALSQYAASSPALECVYIFPLDEESAVFSFIAELDGVIVEGRIREKMEARAEYKSALAMNRSAMLLEQSSDNIFQIKVGNLNPGSVCTITLTYLTLLDQQGRHNRLTLPMIIAPKYTPSSSGPTPPFMPQLEPAPHNTIHKGYHCHDCLCSPIIGTRHHCDTCAYDLCHGCYMHHDMTHCMLSAPGSSSCNPPTYLPSTPPHTAVESKLRNLTIKLTITMPSPIVSIQCPSHPSETQVTHTKDLPSHATALFHSLDSCSLSKDFILLIEQQRCFDPRVLCELDMPNKTAAVSLAFMPPPIDMLSASQIQCELIFLIDCSGSMQGSSITCVRECMQLLLRSLPVHSHFNIVTFGSTWSSLFPSSRAYDDTSLRTASQFISTLQANLGGTEIYPPLLHVLTSNSLPTHPRQVFLLTDGQVSNVEQLVQLTSKHAVSTRLFTFGIGGAVDRLLCKKLAQAGRGKCEFVTADDGGGAGMREKVVRQVARAMQPVLTDVKVNWGQLKAAPNTSASIRAPFLQCPSIAPAIFMSSRYVLHALNVSLPDFAWQQASAGQKVQFNCEITVTAQSNHPREKGSMHHSVVLTGEQITQACVIHTLAAKERIRELENQVRTSTGETKKRLEDEILQVALKYTLSSSRTSFVAVHDAGTVNERFEGAAPFHNAEETFSVMPMASFHQFSMPTAQPGALPAAFMPVMAHTSTSLTSFNSAGGGALFGSSTPFGSAAAEHESFGCLKSAGNMGGFFGKAERMPASRRKHQAVTPTNTLFGSVGHAPQDLLEVDANTTPFENIFQLRSAMPAFPRKHQAVTSTNTLFGSVDHAPQDLLGVDANTTPFENLIQLQSAKGTWKITPMLIDIVHAIVPSSFSTITMQSLQAVGKQHGVDEAVVGVIVSLQLLEVYYKPRHAEWEMLATKALFFLNEDAKTSAKLQEDIKASIVKLLGN